MSLFILPQSSHLCIPRGNVLGVFFINVYVFLHIWFWCLMLFLYLSIVCVVLPFIFYVGDVYGWQILMLSSNYGCLLFVIKYLLPFNSSKANPCRSGYSWGPNNHCYHFHNTRMAWDDAKDYCTSTRPDAYLAEVTSSEENDFIQDLADGKYEMCVLM